MSEYKLKNSPFDVGRVKKITKVALDECKEDRKLALAAYDYFKKRVNDTGVEARTDDKQAMMDSLKLVQSSKTAAVRLLTLMVKLELGEKNIDAKTGKSKEMPTWYEMQED